MPDDQSRFEQPNLPAAVRRQMAEAEQLAREAGVRNVPEAEGAPPGAPEGAPPQAAQEPQQSTETRFDLSQPAEAPPEAQPDAPPQDDNWEHKYKSLQGRFDAETNRARQMRSELDSLRDVVASLQRPQQQPQQGWAPPPSHEIPQADVDNFGADLIEATQRWADARVAPRLQEYERRMLALEGTQHQLQAQTVQQRCDAELDRGMPNWRQINVSDDFIDWLNQYDTFSGQPRLGMLQEAYRAGQGARCLAFFRAYTQEVSAVPQPLGISPSPSPAPGAGAGQVPLAQLASPGRGSGPLQSPGNAPAQRTWNGDEIMRLAREQQRGLWRGREAEYERLQQDIIAAGRDGRYRPQQ
jgi:hypothetical protein